MAEVTPIVNATKEGMLIWTIVVTVFLGVYAFYKYRDGEAREGVVSIGAAIFIFLLGWATDYYHGVWIGGAMMGVSVLMYFTSHDEGMIQKLFLWTGAGLLVISTLGYVFPLVVPGGVSGFLLGAVIIGGMLVVDVHLDRYLHDWELMLVFALGVGGAVLLNYYFGLDHAWHGLVLMYMAAALALLGIYTKLVDPMFIAGFLLWLDDIVGHGTGGDPRPDELIKLWFVLGFIVSSVYVIRRWRE